MSTMENKKDKTAADPVLVEVVRHSMISIMDQVEANLIRMAYSLLVYMFKDFSVGLLDPEGRLIATSNGSLPTFLPGMAAQLRDALELYKEEGINEGDVILNNYSGVAGQHLNNVLSLQPVYNHGKLIAFMGVAVHWADVGGKVPGSSGLRDSVHIVEEGFQLHTVKVKRGGKIVPETIRVIECNTRFPDKVLGDLEGQITVSQQGCDLYNSLVDKYGLDNVMASIHEIWNQSEEKSRAAIRAIPDGDYYAESFLDNDGINMDKTVPIRIHVNIKDSEYTLDYSDMSDQLEGPYNSGYYGGAVMVSRLILQYLMNNHELANEGCYRNLHIIAPEGKMVNATAWAPKAAYILPLCTVVDTALKATDSVMPEYATGGHHSSFGAYEFFGTNSASGSMYNIVDTVHGGHGAFLGSDGVGQFKTLAHGDTLGIPVEVAEGNGDVMVNEYTLRQDSAGAGQWRGGLGCIKRVTATAPVFLNTLFERKGCPPWGTYGGSAAKPTEGWIIRKDGTVEESQKSQKVLLNTGDTFLLLAGGGGGYGEAKKRDVQAVLEDVRIGYVSPEGAEKDYGVKVDCIGGEWVVDEAATKKLRAAM